MAGGGRRPRGLRRNTPTKIDGPRSEINVTPLVDVVLVLLIIFMVIMPLLARGKDVPLPRTRHHSTDADKNQPIVAIDDKGQVYFDKDHITDVLPLTATGGQRRWQLKDPDVLRRTLDDAWRRAEEQRTDEQESVMHRVFFKADNDLPYGMVYPVIMALHDMGVTEIDLGTNELKEQAAAAP